MTGMRLTPIIAQGGSLQAACVASLTTPTVLRYQKKIYLLCQDKCVEEKFSVQQYLEYHTQTEGGGADSDQGGGPTPDVGTVYS